MGCLKLTYYPKPDLTVVGIGTEELTSKSIIGNTRKATGYKFNAKEMDEETGLNGYNITYQYGFVPSEFKKVVSTYNSLLSE